MIEIDQNGMHARFLVMCLLNDKAGGNTVNWSGTLKFLPVGKQLESTVIWSEGQFNVMKKSKMK